MTIRTAFLFLAAAASIFQFACATKSDPPKLAYEMSHNGCTTGHHDFPSLETMCSGLQDESFNNSCARTEREAYFKQNCSGKFKPAMKSYVFSDGKCQTGRHGFSNNAELCRVLQNEKSNLYCMEAQRESYFKQQCKGEFKNGKNATSSALSGGKTGVVRDLDCKGYYLSPGTGPTSGVQPISWSARDLNENVFPEMPEHSSIVLTCTRVNEK